MSIPRSDKDRAIRIRTCVAEEWRATLVRASCTSRKITMARCSSSASNSALHSYRSARAGSRERHSLAQCSRAATRPKSSRPTGPQLPDQAAQHIVNPVDVDDHGTRRVANGGVVRSRIAHRHRVELDRIDVLSQFIVQIVSERLAFMFLHVQVFQRQLLIFRHGLCQPGLRQPRAGRAAASPRSTAATRTISGKWQRPGRFRATHRAAGFRAGGSSLPALRSRRTSRTRLPRSRTRR